MTRTTAAALALGSALTLAACTGNSSTAKPGGTSSAPAATTPAATSAATSGAPSVAPSSGGQSSSGPGSPSGTPAASVPATVTAPATSAGSKPSPATSASSTRCTNSQLTLSLGRADRGAGQIYSQLVFVNKGATTCTLVGHPGVSYVTGDNGRQVGASAARTGSSTTVTLAPGGSASALLHETNYQNFDQAACKPIPVRGLRVYPPGSTRSLFVARVTTQCSATTLPDPALSIAAVKAGSGA